MKISGTFFLILLLIIFSFTKEAVAQKSVQTFTKNIFSSAILEDKRLTEIQSSRGWKKLLHLERNLVGLEKSQVTDPMFFLSNEAQFKNMTELEATLIGFVQPALNFEEKAPHPQKKYNNIEISDHSRHPVCRFPARLKFLKNALPDRKDFWELLPNVNCIYQKIFLEALDPESVSFVFSSYYADSPGSAFGHTFFRFNRKSNEPNNRQELLDYGIGYAANVTVSNGALYALLGLAGGFTGSWTNLPYYYKVREYNDFEARDLWSYDLNLTFDEVEMLSLHFWEVGAHYYTYFFFTQNCAFHMLTVLEAAAPRLYLIEHVPFLYVIPSDSLKSLFFEKDLVKTVSFRPSIRKTFLDRVHRLDPATSVVFKEYASSGFRTENYNRLNENQKSLFLDAAIDLIDLRNPNINIDFKSNSYQAKEKLLSERAGISVTTQELRIPVNENDQPEKSHGSSRLGLTYYEKGRFKQGEVNYRFALHDLQDPQVGLPKNSQLEFFNFKFKLVSNEIKFQEMALFRVLNLNPTNFFENVPSWGAEIGIQNTNNYCYSLDTDCFLNGALIKYGRSIGAFSDHFLVWSLATANIRYGATLLDSKIYLAPGFELGTIFRLSDFSSVLTSFSREYPINRDNSFHQNYNFEIRHAFHKDFVLGTNVKNDNYGIFLYLYY